jgi:diadenosine tetraphosphate (Ap4A) HIT family hydrolase
VFDSTCPLCSTDGGELLHRAPSWRLVLADEPDWPGLVRIIWNEHVAELSDLSAPEAQALMAVVRQVERVLRDTLAPDKVNVASLGNQVPHLHVHIVPRWRDDLTFPGSIWTRPETGLSDNIASSDRAAAALARRQSTALRVPALRTALLSSSHSSSNDSPASHPH